MNIAVINTGSSSLKFKLFDMKTKTILHSVLIEHIGEKNSNIKNHLQALQSIDIDFSKIDMIGHRVVHGGEIFKKPTIIDDSIIQAIERLIPLAPLHNYANVLGIKVAMKKAPQAIQVAVFDTSFHSTMPEVAYRYALPKELYEKHSIRRYGFHGSSHSYLLKQVSSILNKKMSDLSIITLHLGNGASACAIENGKSIDTSMGFTPLEGLVMGTRCGDIDPAIVLYMQRELGYSVDEIDDILNKQSGLEGVCGSSDMRDIESLDDKDSSLALWMMIRRVKKYIGSYMAILDRVDAVVFSGGIGENSKFVRDNIMDTKMFSNIKTLVINTDEEMEIAMECFDLNPPLQIIHQSKFRNSSNS